MDNNTKPKKRGYLNFFTTIQLFIVPTIICAGFDIFLIIEMIKALKNGKTADNLLLVLMFLVVSLIIYGLIRFYLHSLIRFYGDGFLIGLKKQKIKYENLEYFFLPGIMPNSFRSIIYRLDDNNKWKEIDASKYFGKRLFDDLQNDIVKITFPLAINNIESGGKEVFPFKEKISFRSFSAKKIANEIENKGNEITITKNYISFDNEIYKWENYEFIANDGLIEIYDLNGNDILRITNNHLFRPNLCMKLINHFKQN